MKDFPVNSVDVARWFVRVLALGMMVAVGFNIIETLIRIFLIPRFSLPLIYVLPSVSGLVLWGFIWLFSGGIGEALAFETHEENQLSTNALRALALPCFGFFVGANGLANWISNLSFALMGAATSSNIRTPVESLLRELNKSQGRELLLLLVPVLLIGIGFFFAFIFPRLRVRRSFVDETQTTL